MTEKLSGLWPEIMLFGVTCLVMLVGLSRSLSVRKMCSPLAALGLVAAGFLAFTTTPPGMGMLPNLAQYGKVITAIVGLLLVLMLSGLPDREYEAAVATGRARFDAARTVRAEFYAFFLFSLTGVMLCAGSTNLIWLFLALELTSLPTYVMVALSTPREKAMEASVKYFFLGAMSAAMFLMGFALLYGATGTVEIEPMARALRAQAGAGGINEIALVGMILSILGLCFKIAAVPMHFYTPDVYQGAASPVSAMLAYVPKAAGFFALIILCGAIGWGDDARGSLPTPVGELLTIIAVLTMTFGNVLALLQSSVKRVLAYSSIAHSGYMLVALVSGPGMIGRASPASGVVAILFYLLIYGITNSAAFSVLSALEKPARDGSVDEADDFADVRGLRKTQPALAWVMTVAALGLMGFPPLVGFFAKLPLFMTAWTAGQTVVLIILAINSAIAAFYYLRIVSVTLLDSPDATSRVGEFRASAYPNRATAGIIAAILIVALPFLSFVPAINPLRAAIYGGQYEGVVVTTPDPAPTTPAEPAPPATPTHVSVK